MSLQKLKSAEENFVNEFNTTIELLTDIFCTLYRKKDYFIEKRKVWVETVRDFMRRLKEYLYGNKFFELLVKKTEEEFIYTYSLYFK